MALAPLPWIALTAGPFSWVIVPPVHAPSVWKSMSNTVGLTAGPPVNGVPVMLTLIPPVEVYRQFPALSRAACSWYCHREFVAGVQQGPTAVLQGTGAAHPAVGQLACAGGARTSTDPMPTKEVRSKKVPSGMLHRFMAISPRRAWLRCSAMIARDRKSVV